MDECWEEGKGSINERCSRGMDVCEDEYVEKDKEGCGVRKLGN